MSVAKVTAGVWRAGTRYVNWYIVDGGADGLTVVDTGLPGYRRRLAAQLQDMGHRLQDVRAVVLTHGHADHVGAAGTLARGGAPVYLHPADRELARNPRRNRTDANPVPYLRFPATAAFAAHAVAQGAFRPQPLPPTVPLVDGAELDVPGAPLVTHVPGHTDGSCLLDFPQHGVVFVGDLLCTVDPVWGSAAPAQLQTRGSNRNSDQAMTSLARLEQLEAKIVLPGHGGPWRDGVAAAVASARRIGCR